VRRRFITPLIPAKAGTQVLLTTNLTNPTNARLGLFVWFVMLAVEILLPAQREKAWVPAFAGMSGV